MLILVLVHVEFNFLASVCCATIFFSPIYFFNFVNAQIKRLYCICI